MRTQQRPISRIRANERPAAPRPGDATGAPAEPRLAAPQPIASLPSDSRVAALEGPAHDAPSAEPPLHRGLVVVTTVAALILVFFKLGVYRTFGRHEAFAVVCAREMIATGDWIVPRFGGVPRFEKPPLGYWAVAASARLFGGLDETTARLPAAVSSLLLAALVGWWGVRWHGRTAGFAAGVATISSLLVLTYARRAEVDMLLCLLTTGAMFLIADQPASEQGRRAFARWTGIYALLSLAWLAKFHYGPVMALAPTFCFAVVQRRWRIFLHALNPLGLAMLAAAATVWSGMVAARVPEAAAVWRVETLGRVVGDLGRLPVWFYVLEVLIVPLPWTPLILLAAPHSLRQAWSSLRDGLATALRERSLPRLFATWGDSARRDDARQRFLWIWFGVQIALLTSMADKHSHYLAATLPMLALLAGRGVRQVVDRLRRGEFEIGGPLASGVTLAVLGLALAGVLIGVDRWPEHAGACVLIGAVIAIGCAGSIRLMQSRAYVPATITVVASFVVCSMLTATRMVPADDYRRPAADFARALRDEAGADATLYAYRVGTDPFVYYLGHPARRLESPDEVDRLLRDHRSARLVTHEALLPDLEPLGEVSVRRRLTTTDGVRSHAPPALVDVELTERDPRPPSMKSDVRFAKEPKR